MTAERPHYVCCVFLGYVDVLGYVENPNPKKPHDQTWCGRVTSQTQEFVFKDPTHALLSIRNGDMTRICPACARAMAKMAKEGAYEP
ncbi:MAG: hypothetical protein ACYDH4_09510 [Candidatus Cryosericum sp.]